ncbi:helix-turn-helix domain-containing protein [Cytobacillus firmus]|uniref:helix-turn-helix domain-containing protein n=1 Tax=Cytobacillus firmus TaxID=1399 RepID=UPI003BA1A824
MSRVSKYRTGEPRFGKKGSPDSWDSSVKVSVLSPEELAAYRNGERGGSKLFTYEDFLELEKQGLSKQQIADKMGISVATLYNRIKAWKSKAGKTPSKQETDTTGAPMLVAGEVPADKMAELESLAKDLKKKISDAEEELSAKTARVKELEDQLTAVLNGNSSNEELEKKIASLQDEKSDLLHQQLHDGYQIENLKKSLSDLKDTFSTIERENVAMRELLRLWI